MTGASFPRVLRRGDRCQWPMCFADDLGDGWCAVHGDLLAARCGGYTGAVASAVGFTAGALVAWRLVRR